MLHTLRDFGSADQVTLEIAILRHGAALRLAAAGGFQRPKSGKCASFR
jgi:hypothetical protein